MAYVSVLLTPLDRTSHIFLLSLPVSILVGLALARLPGQSHNVTGMENVGGHGAAAGHGRLLSPTLFLQIQQGMEQEGEQGPRWLAHSACFLCERLGDTWRTGARPYGDQEGVSPGHASCNVEIVVNRIMVALWEETYVNSVLHC